MTHPGSAFRHKAARCARRRMWAGAALLAWVTAAVAWARITSATPALLIIDVQHGFLPGKLGWFGFRAASCMWWRMPPCALAFVGMVVCASDNAPAGLAHRGRTANMPGRSCCGRRHQRAAPVGRIPHGRHHPRLPPPGLPLLARQHKDPLGPWQAPAHCWQPPIPAVRPPPLPRAKHTRRRAMSALLPHTLASARATACACSTRQTGG